MKTLKRFLVRVMAIGLVTAIPISASAQPMMGPGMGYGNMGPGMMGGYGPGYGMGPGMMGGYGQGYGMGPGMMGGWGMGPGMMGPGMMGGWGMGPGMMGGWGMGPGMMGPGTMGGAYGGVNLTEEQSAKIVAVQEDFSKKQWDVMTQMQDEQFKLQQLYSAPTRDNAAINEEFKKLNQLRRQMWDNMADAQKKSEAVLTNEQRNSMRRWGGRHMWGW